jgi:fructose-bisphosphate aldolase class I
MTAVAMETTLVARLDPGKRILAADGSLPTLGRTFRAPGIPPTAENRRACRESLFATPALGGFIGGVILLDETPRL